MGDPSILGNWESGGNEFSVVTVDGELLVVSRHGHKGPPAFMHGIEKRLADTL